MIQSQWKEISRPGLEGSRSSNGGEGRLSHHRREEEASFAMDVQSNWPPSTQVRETMASMMRKVRFLDRRSNKSRRPGLIGDGFCHHAPLSSLSAAHGPRISIPRTGILVTID